jgi:hypothetical protein
MGARAVRWLLFCFLAGCSDGPNSQYRPIGTDCTADDQCGTKPYSCSTKNHPNGYCQKDCATPGDCPSDSTCVAMECRRKCTMQSDCRVAEGYMCSGSPAVCDFPVSSNDGGAP